MCDIVRFRAKAAMQVFASLTSNSISWALIHGGEGYPVSVGRDFDVLIEKKDQVKALAIVEKTLVENGWMVSFVALPWNVTQVIASKSAECGIVALEIDFVTYLTWHGVGLVGGLFNEKEVEIRNELRCAIWAGFVKRVLIQCLTGNWEKLASKPHEWRLFGQEERVVPVRLGYFADAVTARHFLSALRGGDVEELKKSTHVLRRKILFKSIFTGRFFNGDTIQWIKDKIACKMLLKQRAPVVDICFSPEMKMRLIKNVLNNLKDAVEKRLVFAQVKLLSEKESRNWGFDTLLNSANVNLTIRQKKHRSVDKNIHNILNIDVLSISLHNEQLRMLWNDDRMCYDVPRDTASLLFCDLVMRSMHQLWATKNNS